MDCRAAGHKNLVRDEGSVKVALAGQLQRRVGGVHRAVEVAAPCQFCIRGAGIIDLKCRRIAVRVDDRASAEV